MDQLTEASAWAPLAADGLSDVVLLLVRVIFGIIYLYYGIPKLRDLAKNAQDFEQMGFKPGWFWGTPIALLETFGSLAVMLGGVPVVFCRGFCHPHGHRHGLEDHQHRQKVLRLVL
ncbi:MAG: DoxX family protein [Anaerolineae bacterium]|nr:DoxX family protein [Anaerolineae bacterium]